MSAEEWIRLAKCECPAISEVSARAMPPLLLPRLLLCSGLSPRCFSAALERINELGKNDGSGEVYRDLLAPASTATWGMARAMGTRKAFTRKLFRRVTAYLRLEGEGQESQMEGGASEPRGAVKDFQEWLASEVSSVSKATGREGGKKAEKKATASPTVPAGASAGPSQPTASTSGPLSRPQSLAFTSARAKVLGPESRRVAGRSDGSAATLPTLTVGSPGSTAPPTTLPFSSSGGSADPSLGLLLLAGIISREAPVAAEDERAEASTDAPAPEDEAEAMDVDDPLAGGGPVMEAAKQLQREVRRGNSARVQARLWEDLVGLLSSWSTVETPAEEDQQTGGLAVVARVVEALASRLGEALSLPQPHTTAAAAVSSSKPRACEGGHGQLTATQLLQVHLLCDLCQLHWTTEPVGPRCQDLLGELLFVGLVTCRGAAVRVALLSKVCQSFGADQLEPLFRRVLSSAQHDKDPSLRCDISAVLAFLQVYFRHPDLVPFVTENGVTPVTATGLTKLLATKGSLPTLASGPTASPACLSADETAAFITLVLMSLTPEPASALPPHACPLWPAFYRDHCSILCMRMAFRSAVFRARATQYLLRKVSGAEEASSNRGSASSASLGGPVGPAASSSKVFSSHSDGVKESLLLRLYLSFPDELAHSFRRQRWDARDVVRILCRGQALLSGPLQSFLERRIPGDVAYLTRLGHDALRDADAVGTPGGSLPRFQAPSCANGRVCVVSRGRPGECSHGPSA